MAENGNGLYYESKQIRNEVLSRNIGSYAGYGNSLLINGGLAIGMPYVNETELTPFPIDFRSNPAGRGGNVVYNSYDNPRLLSVNREFGLFGYTHEVINPESDWINRSQNILDGYFDYGSTEDIRMELGKFPSAMPWSIPGGGLRAFSSFSNSHNSPYFHDYRVYAKTIFTNGLPSFEKHLGEGYLGRLLFNGFNGGKKETGPSGFVDERAGYIVDDVDAQLKPIEDTKLAYIGRILLDEEKLKQMNAVDFRRSTHEFGITTELVNFYGLSSESMEKLKNGEPFSAGISKDNKNLFEETFIGRGEFQVKKRNELLKESFYNKKYKRDKYADYHNVNTEGGIIYEEGDWDNENNEFFDDLYGSNAVWHKENIKKTLGDSIEGFFDGVGVEDVGLTSNEHYDEQDGINRGERDLTSKKNGEERIGLWNSGNTGNFSTSDFSILEKTKRLFEAHKIKTLIGRFHTSSDDRGSKISGLTQTAIDPTYGISHGRNLLKLDKTYENGYENPYCRVWTYHHQYSQMRDLIRPFTDTDSGGTVHFLSLDAIQANYPGRPIVKDGATGSWSEKSVLNTNGMVNVAPIGRLESGQKKIAAKQCMFSIENLAWKGVLKNHRDSIDEGEIGPLGGRIMWFPPYNLSFNESVSASWTPNDFIGRGEKVYSYNNTERTGSLSFTILADHPSILDYWMNTDNRWGSLGSEDDQQKVLRFFAGCENLEADDDFGFEKKNGSTSSEDSKNDTTYGADKTATDKDNNVNEEVKTGEAPEFTTANSISFYVFFPNNLSGYDWLKNPKVIANYLVQGRNGFEFNFDKERFNSSVAVPNWDDNVIVETNPGYPGYEMGSTGLTDDYTRSKIKAENIKSANVKGRNFIWGYGIDYDKVKEKLCGPHSAKSKGGDGSFKVYPENYMDKANFSLNSTANSKDEACAYSFKDVVGAISPDYNHKNNFSTEASKEIQKILGMVGDDNNPVKNSAKKKLYFSIAGGASVHGYESKNVGLSQRRASFLRAWLEYCFKANNLEIDYKELNNIPVKTGISGGENDLDINSESAKRGRYAKAVIYWDDEETKDASEQDRKYETTGGTPAIRVQDQAVRKQVIDPAESTGLERTTMFNRKEKTRYHDEELFFSLLKEESPVVYKNIVDKVKYFDPVFHSITPEGFNARLSFLHQCTRQGPTTSSSESKTGSGLSQAGYAGNLSFGRAPVCVLRLGDFYNTRIVINSVQIQYETSQWDLNPEGIGVQPMLANVTLSFSFQGGSSLGGPIQRLQNAVSFNYYANQEVYDDRADYAVYNGGKLDTKATYIWMPGYGRRTIGDIVELQKKEWESQNSSQKTTVENAEENSNLNAKNAQEQGASNGQEEIGRRAQ